MNWNSIKHQNRFWALGIKRLKYLTSSLPSQIQKIRLGKITRFQRYLALGFCCIFLGITLIQFPVLSTSVNISTVRQEQSENLLSQGIINPTNSISHQREFRGVWVATVANIDWPSKSNLSVDQQKFELIAILNRMQELNLNALILQAYQYGDLMWMEPGAKEVQDQTYNVIMDVVQRYDVDGIHLDDYFYPYPKDGIPFPDSQIYNAYRANGGNLGLSDWRRQNVNLMIKRIHDGIKATKPYVKFGISPFGIYRPGKAPGIVGLDQYDSLYADVKLWVEQGWMDYLSPQLYWKVDPPQQSYPVLLDWWLQHNPQRRHIYAGNSLYRIEDEWPISEIQRQIAISRQKAPQLSLGNVFFSMKIFRDNRQGVNEIFKSAVYPTPALVPIMPWLDNQPPESPSGIETNSGMISWNPSNTNDIRSWAIYQQFSTGWQLVKVVNKDTNSVRVNPGNYAIRAVDRIGNESVEQVVSVS